MNFRPVKLESPFFKQLKNYKQLQEDFGKLQDDTGVNEMESFLKIEVWIFNSWFKWFLTVAHYFSHLETTKLSIQPNYFWVNWKKTFSQIQSILMLITEKTLFTSPFTDKQTVFQMKMMTSKMLTPKRIHIEQFTSEYCTMVKNWNIFWIVMFHIYYCINYISYYIWRKNAFARQVSWERFLRTPSPGSVRALYRAVPRPGFPTYAVKIYPYIIHFEVQF